MTDLPAEIAQAFAAARARVAVWEPAPMEPKPAERDRPLTKQQQAWFDAYQPPTRDWVYGDDPLLVADRSWWR